MENKILRKKEIDFNQQCLQKIKYNALGPVAWELALYSFVFIVSFAFKVFESM